MSGIPLHERTCKACEGGVDPVGENELASWRRDVPQWQLAEDGKSIYRKWNTGDFVKAISAMREIAELAEADAHHPDLHLTGYRHLKVVLTTHAIGGLSENDFILAAKIDRRLDQAPADDSDIVGPA
ncbi:MAG: 4a-hydroxytetrahydrobiopterin dehydratase [Planctomycetota bacterium]